MDEVSTEKPLPTVTAGESKNGWTPEKLAIYLAEREAQKLDFMTRNAARKQARIQNTTSFNPHRW